MKAFRIYLLPIWAILITLTACDLQQEVELDLPEYEPLLVVESYLQPGNPYIVTLIESADFYGDIQINFVRDAEVVISHNGINDTLVPFEIPLDFAFPPGFVDTTLLQQLGPILGEGAYIYTSLNTVPEDYNSEFKLSATAPDGRSLSARTFIPAPVEADSIIVRFNEDSLALMLTQFQDDPNQANFYRRILERRVVDTIVSETGDTSFNYRSRTEQDFFTDDEINNGEIITFGTLFEYQKGDSLINTIYHVTEDYSRFVETRDAAIIASFSPFAPPTVVFSNIEGGLGIFTGFTFTERLTVIE
ncbi:MAG: DUF4249 domain-containing protein [Bacteroidota bacterium]